MPNIYCRSCGIGTKYLYEKPENCPSCSKSYARPLVIPEAKAKVKTKKQEIIEDDEEEELEDEELYEDDEIEQVVYNSRNRKKVKNILANVKVQVDRDGVFKLGEIIGSDPDAESFSREGMTQEEYKRRIFESKPTSID